MSLAAVGLRHGCRVSTRWAVLSQPASCSAQLSSIQLSVVWASLSSVCGCPEVCLWMPGVLRAVCSYLHNFPFTRKLSFKWSNL